MAELGWLGINVPAEYGGSELSLAEVVPIAEAMGRRLFASPFMPTVLACQLLLDAATPAQKTQWLPRLCGGAVAALALSEPDGDWELGRPTCRAAVDGDVASLAGVKTFVNDAPLADLMIVSLECAGEPALALLDTEAIARAAIVRETVISFETIQFFVSRSTPTITPMTVAATQPSTATSSVLRMPTTAAVA